MPRSSRSDTSGEIYRRKTSWAVGVSWVWGAFYVPRNWNREEPAAVAEPRDCTRSTVTQVETRSVVVKESTLSLWGQRKQCGLILSTVVSHERFEAGNDMIWFIFLKYQSRGMDEGERGQQEWKPLSVMSPLQRPGKRGSGFDYSNGVRIDRSWRQMGWGTGCKNNNVSRV